MCLVTIDYVEELAGSYLKVINPAKRVAVVASPSQYKYDMMNKDINALYTFMNKDTDEVFTEMMSISQREEYLSEIQTSPTNCES